jgi:hypothetical protein
MKYNDIKQCVSVVISNHALTQWNERVGPYAESCEKLEKIIFNYLQELDRLDITRRDCLVLDGEIVAASIITPDNKLVIESFFGRISLNPILDDHDMLSHFMKKQIKGKRNSKLVRSIKHEGINLSLPRDVLNKQTFPEFPEIISTVKIMSNGFKLSYWRSGEIKVKQITGNNGVGQQFNADVEHPHLVYDRVKPNSLSHIHIAKLCAAIADFQDSVDREKVLVLE